jgi:uncharacterized protein YraI
MKKTLALAFVLLLVAVVVADAAVIKVKVATANVRAKPDLMAPVITRVNQGALFEVQNKIGTWYEISAVDSAGNIVTGYINADVVEEVGGGGAAPAQPAAQAPAPVAAKPAASSYYSSGAKAAGGFFITAGPVLSSLAVSNEDLGDTTKSPRFGFAAGVGYEMPIAENLSLNPAVLFATGGVVYKSGSDKITYKANALGIPILIKYNLGGPFAFLGPNLGFVLSPKVSYDIQGQTGEEDVDTANINTFVFGLVFGAGFETSMGTSKVGVQLAYNLGLSKLNKEGTDSVKPTGIYILGFIKL